MKYRPSPSWMAIGAAAALLAVPAAALSLGEADLRSFASQPLDVRIPVLTPSREPFDLSCVLVRTGTREPQPLPGQRLRLIETLDSRTLVIRTLEPINDRLLVIEVSAQCAGNPAVTRSYALELPVLGDTAAAPPAQPAASLSPSPVPASPVMAAGGARGLVWSIGDGDSLRVIVQGLFPGSTALQSAYLGRIRAANPTLTAADDAVLPRGTQVRLPDLRAFANDSVRYAPPAAPSPAVPAASSPARTKSSRVPAGTVPRPALAPAPSIVPAPKAPPRQVPAPPATAAQPTTGGFSLRLSGAQIDLSRSRGVTESMRASLRDKQLVLDADDQVAALLTLKETVKRLELRINEMQLKLSTNAQFAAPVPPPVVSDARSAQAVVPVAKDPTAAPVPQSEQQPAPPPAQPPAPATSATKAVPPPQAITPAPAQPASPVADEGPWWLSSWLWIGGGTAALVVLLGYLFSRRSATQHTAFEEPATPSGQLGTGDTSGFSDWASDPPLEPDAAAPPPQEGGTAPQEKPARARQATPATVATDDVPASLELDTRPATSVDFPLLGDEGSDDKARRVRYMEERYPELANKSVSPDEPDSVIDAARHYFEENQIQKAAELLTYAFEERPGQLRFWLALFEIYRLERRTGEFADLAIRFKNVHGGTDAWPKVQHIGRDLDASNPLYAAALGRLGVAADREFDAVAENWLNVPMDFTSDVLMSELRRNLLEENGVNPAELNTQTVVPA